jgi:polyisoprenyl-teichoic acid--peptidoglycan teichoic acid transferase
MNFNAFIDVVDALNGIEVDVPYEINEVDSKDNQKSVHLMPGVQTVNGEQALALARTRKKDSDIYRGERQQEILKAIMKKATTAGAITKYTDLMEAVGDNMTTNLTFNEMKSFISYVTSGKGIDVQSVKLKGSDSTINGVYYYQLDEASVAEAQATLKDHLDISDNTADQSAQNSSDN